MRSLTLVALFFIGLHLSAHDGFVHVKDNKLCNGNDQRITLDGVNLGGWLLWEGWIWGGGFTAESTMKERLRELMGEEKYLQFLDGYYHSYITEKDIEAIAAHKMNCVRLPFNHRIFESTEVDGFAMVDSVIEWCSRHHLYVVLDLHAAPGGQNNYFIADPEKENLWKSEEKRKQTLGLWKKIALRYRDETTVAGYDLMNEPNAPTSGQLVSFYQELAAAIRSVDTRHLLIIEGNHLAHTFEGFPALIDDNQLYSYHYYAWFAERHKKKALDKILRAIHSDLPLWCGEWGEDTRENLVEITELVHALPQNCGMCFWTWKRVYKNNNRFPFCAVNVGENWNKVMRYLTHGRKRPTEDEVTKGMDEFLSAIQFENCVVHKLR